MNAQNQLSFHPYLRGGWTGSTLATRLTVEPCLPDVNPADAVVARIRHRRFGSERGNVINGVPGGSGGGDDPGAPPGGGDPGGGGSGGTGGGGGGGAGGGGAVNGVPGAYLQDQIDAITDRLNAAGITAECNEDGTLTVTLTL